MASSTTAPVYQPLTIEQGADFEMQIPFTDGVTGDPIPVGSPAMQIRAAQYDEAPLLVAPVVSASGNTVTATVAGTASLGLAPSTVSGFYDVFVTRTDTGAVVKLAAGPVTFVPNVTTP